VGNCNEDISSEEHFENSKTRRGIYLQQEVFIFVQIFEIYLVTESLYNCKYKDNLFLLIFDPLCHNLTKSSKKV
jgi:hypothetical protein